MPNADPISLWSWRDLKAVPHGSALPDACAGPSSAGEASAGRGSTAFGSVCCAIAKPPCPFRYFAVGITNSAPFAIVSGQRCITLFCLV